MAGFLLMTLNIPYIKYGYAKKCDAGHIIHFLTDKCDKRAKFALFFTAGHAGGLSSPGC